MWTPGSAMRRREGERERALKGKPTSTNKGKPTIQELPCSGTSREEKRDSRDFLSSLRDGRKADDGDEKERKANCRPR